MASRKLKLGDIVYCQRSTIWGADLYLHFGVYVGNKKIIHYDKDKSAIDGVVAVTSIDEFRKGDTLYIAEDDTLTSLFQDKGLEKKFFSAKETVRRAREKIGERKYNLFFHNCEHFAVWCKTGLEVSTQASISGVLIKGIEPDGIVTGTIFRFLRNHIWRVEAEY